MYFGMYLCGMFPLIPKRTSFLLSCFTFVMFSSVFTYAQVDQLRSEQFTTENGLSSNVIHSLLQDTKGYLWIGTNDGLNRYDGYNFKVFRNIPGDKTSLIENTVIGMYEDADGNIWIGTNGGLCRYNYMKNNFIQINLFQKVARETVNQILEVNKNELMIITDGGIGLLNMHTLRFEKIKDEQNQLASFSMHGLSKDKNGNIYLVASLASSPMKNIFAYDQKHKRFQPVANNSSTKKTGTARLLFFDSHNSYWLFLFFLIRNYLQQAETVCVFDHKQKCPSWGHGH